MSKVIIDEVEQLLDILKHGSASDLERLAADLIGELIDLPVRRAASGSQHGADAGAISIVNSIRIEAKRYRETTRLSERELLGEITQVIQVDPSIDAWILVSTTTVPEQISISLKKYGIGNGIPIIIIDRAGKVPILAQLCAAFPDVVQNTHGQEAGILAESISRKCDIQQARNTLRMEIKEWSAGWAMTTKHCCNVATKLLTDESESRFVFRQNLAVADSNAGLVHRDELITQFDNWKDEAIHGSPLLVIGEEGLGKSWVLAHWLFEHTNNEILLIYCSSSELRSLRDTTVNSVLTHILAKRISSLNEDYWLARFRRLNNAPIPDNPFIYLVIDGLNEVPKADWIGLFLDAQRDICRSRLRIIASCRTRYYEETLKRGQAWTTTPTIIEVPQYTPDQRDEALRLQGVNLSDLSESVLSLARKARVCRLITYMADRLKGVKQITYERLLFEYGKRFDPDARLGLNDDFWHAFLRELARNIQNGVPTARLSEVRTWIDITERETVEVALNDIIDGHLVQHSIGRPGFLDFDRDLVLVANGMALWKHLEKANTSDHHYISNLIARELEPLGGVDEQSHIIVSALAFALVSQSSPEVVRIIVASLIAEGICLQNLGPEDEAGLLSHTEFIPDGYLDTLSNLARIGRDDEAELVFRRIVDKADHDGVQTAISEVAVDWVRIINVNIGDEQDKPEPQRHRTKELLRWLGEIPSAGPLNVLGETIVVEVDGYHRLPLFAVRLMQAMPLSKSPLFWRRFAIASVLDNGQTLREHASWIVRFNQYDYEETCNLISKEADELLKRTPPVNADESLPRRAAAILLWLIKEDKYDIRARELVPKPDGWEMLAELTQDLNNSMFNLYPCQVESVLAESEQHIPILINRVSEWWADPDLSIPLSFVNKLKDHAERLSLTDIRTVSGRTAGDHHLTRAFPAIARCDPSTLTRLCRRILRDLVNRVDDNWSHLCHDMPNLWLIASTEDCAIAKRELERTDITDGDEDRHKYARALLFLLAFARDEPVQYPIALISDDVDSLTEQIILGFKELSTQEVERLFAVATERNTILAEWLFIKVLSHTESPTSLKIAQYLIEKTQSDVNNIRLHALYTLTKSQCGSVCHRFAETGWTWRNIENDAERRHGSDILINATPELPLKELLSRVAPWRLPFAAYQRGSPEDSRIIAKTITGLLSTDELVPRHLFDEHVRTEPTLARMPCESLSLEEPESAVFSVDGIAKLLDVETRRRELREAEQEALRLIAAERVNNHAFYGEWIKPKHLENLLDVAPDELGCWLSDIHGDAQDIKNKVRNASGFYLSLCELLLSRDPELGAKLWQILDQECHMVRFTGNAGLDLKLLMIFEAPECDEVVRLRDEHWKLSRINNNLSLFEVVLAAEAAGCSEWLETRINEDRQSDWPWQRERARFASALCLDPEFDRNALNREPDINTTREYIEYVTEKIAAQAVWQRHWLQTYCTADSPDDAFAAFTLFLEVADARWPLLLQKLSEDGVVMPDERNRYLHMRRRDIDSKVKKFNDDLKKNFLGNRTCPMLWPWLLMYQ